MTIRVDLKQVIMEMHLEIMTRQVPSTTVHVLVSSILRTDVLNYLSALLYLSACSLSNSEG